MLPNIYIVFQFVLYTCKSTEKKWKDRRIAISSTCPPLQAIIALRRKQNRPFQCIGTRLSKIIKRLFHAYTPPPSRPYTLESKGFGNRQTSTSARIEESYSFIPFVGQNSEHISRMRILLGEGQWACSLGKNMKNRCWEMHFITFWKQFLTLYERYWNHDLWACLGIASKY